VAILALAVLLAGCASAYERGQEAFHGGRYAEAAREFEEAAAGGGRSLDALAALGIARYKLGDLPGAREVLRRVLAAEPKRGAARI
jgi:Tfp pilus assembly protein PilF